MNTTEALRLAINSLAREQVSAASRPTPDQASRDRRDAFVARRHAAIIALATLLEAQA